MAGATILASGVLLILALLVRVSDGLIRIRFDLNLVHMLLYGRSTVRRGLVRLRSSGMMFAGHNLHGDRNGQGIAAEKRQPDSQNHCNKFSKSARHIHSLAKCAGSVKCNHIASDPSRQAKFTYASDKELKRFA